MLTAADLDPGGGGAQDAETDDEDDAVERDVDAEVREKVEVVGAADREAMREARWERGKEGATGVEVEVGEVEMKERRVGREAQEGRELMVREKEEEEAVRMAPLHRSAARLIIAVELGCDGATSQHRHARSGLVLTMATLLNDVNRQRVECSGGSKADDSGRGWSGVGSGERSRHSGRDSRAQRPPHRMCGVSGWRHSTHHRAASTSTPSTALSAHRCTPHRAASQPSCTSHLSQPLPSPPLCLAMVQGKGKVSSGSRPGKARPKGRAMTARKAAPHIRPLKDRTTSAINRRNEQLMAGRLAHEGGTLAIVPRPDRVERYEKGGGKGTERQRRELFKSSVARHARMKKEGKAVGEIGERKKEEGGEDGGGGGGGGRKRKRGMEGVRKVGDEWFDEADAEMEQIRYESEDEEENDDPPLPPSISPTNAPPPDAKQPEGPVAEPVVSVTSPMQEEASQVQVVRMEMRRGGEVAAAAAVSVDEVDEVAQATKRAKALLGGWFASRSEKEERRRQSGASQR